MVFKGHKVLESKVVIVISGDRSLMPWRFIYAVHKHHGVIFVADATEGNRNVKPLSESEHD